MKIFIIILFAVSPFFVFAQNQVVLKNGDKFNCNIVGLWSNRLSFDEVIPKIKNDFVDVNNVAVIAGKIQSSTKKSIIKKNPEVIFEETLISEVPTVVNTTDPISTEYQSIVQVDGKTNAQLYSLAREWFAKTFVSSNAVLQMDDAASGKLIGKGFTEVIDSYTTLGMIKVEMFITYKVDFTISVSVREGRYKCEINNINISSDVAEGVIKKQYDTSFSEYAKNAEFYKNAEDPDWLVSNGDLSGKTVSKSTAKIMSPIYGSNYRMIFKVDQKIKSLMANLEEVMKKKESDW